MKRFLYYSLLPLVYYGCHKRKRQRNFPLPHVISSWSFPFKMISPRLKVQRQEPEIEPSCFSIAWTEPQHTDDTNFPRWREAFIQQELLTHLLSICFLLLRLNFLTWKRNQYNTRNTPLDTSMPPQMSFLNGSEVSWADLTLQAF